MNECALGLLVDIGQSRPAVVFRCRPVQQRVMVLAHWVAVARVALREGEQRAVRHDEPGDPKIVLVVQRRVRLWVDPPRCPLTLREDVRTAEHRRLELAATRHGGARGVGGKWHERRHGTEQEQLHGWQLPR